MRLHKSSVWVMLLALCLTFCSCTSKPGGRGSQDPPVQSTEKGSWDSTPKVLEPVAAGTATQNCDVAVLDYSNASEGYIIIDYAGANEKPKLQITGPDNVTYTYNLHGGSEVFPITAGNGSYNVGIFENIEGTQYSPVLSTDIDIKISNEFGPYLYPSQYVNFNKNSLAVNKSKEMAYYCSSDIEVVQSVYNYIIDKFEYDYDKANSIKDGNLTGYLPDVDAVFKANTGICFDYAAVMATMLRTQGIPTRLEVGYMEEAYHAWISTYIENVGWVNGIIEFDGTDWKLMDPTFASTSSSPSDFLTEDNKYTTKYVY